MQFFEEYSHNYGKIITEEKKLYDEVIKSLFVPHVGAAKKSASVFKEAVEANFSARGWIINPSVNSEYNLTINAMKNKVGLTVQTGNISRAFYDLLKFQVMYENDKIDSCILVVPTSQAAKALGSNIANFTRVKNEMFLYKHIINIPCLIIGVDE